jgi:DNA-binding ferritin-like protein
MKTYLKRSKNNKTKKHNKFNYKYTQETIVLAFLQILNTIKLYHWKTYSYSQHKATDKLYDQLNDNIDTFVETMLGKHGNRLDLKEKTNLSVNNFNNLTSFKKKIDEFKNFLINMTKDANLNLTNNSDLLNIRDEILGNINQFEYLLTFH